MNYAVRLALGLLERFSIDPTSVVFAVEFVAGEFGARLLAVELVVHAVKREGFDLGASGDVEVGIFVPAIDINEELSDMAGWFAGKGIRGKF